MKCDTVAPPKFNSSPLKNDGWKTILSFWVPVHVYFQGRTVKLPGGIPRQFSLANLHGRHIAGILADIQLLQLGQDMPSFPEIPTEIN